VGIIHDHTGGLKPLTERERRVYQEIKGFETNRGYSSINWFQENLARGQVNDWKCRAGARYLYICEDGLVHYCSQQRGHPGISLERYTVSDIEREYFTKKACAPSCTDRMRSACFRYGRLARPAIRLLCGRTLEAPRKKI
jgi:MoaA/NifB/PqqE/SkfB family radical SAM enzyme